MMVFASASLAPVELARKNAKSYLIFPSVMEYANAGGQIHDCS